MTVQIVACAAFASTIATPAFAESCFEANKLAVHGLAKWAFDNCQQSFNTTLDYGKLVARMQKGNPDLVAECFNSCRRGEQSESCVKRKIDSIVSSFDQDNRQFLPSFCNDPAYK